MIEFLLAVWTIATLGLALWVFVLHTASTGMRETVRQEWGRQDRLSDALRKSESQLHELVVATMGFKPDSETHLPFVLGTAGENRRDAKRFREACDELKKQRDDVECLKRNLTALSVSVLGGGSEVTYKDWSRACEAATEVRAFLELCGKDAKQLHKTLTWLQSESGAYSAIRREIGDCCGRPVAESDKPYNHGECVAMLRALQASHDIHQQASANLRYAITANVNAPIEEAIREARKNRDSHRSIELIFDLVSIAHRACWDSRKPVTSESDLTSAMGCGCGVIPACPSCQIDTAERDLSLQEMNANG